jgi:WhiB family redox-sensing transcriptional regulator
VLPPPDPADPNAVDEPWQVDGAHVSLDGQRIDRLIRRRARCADPRSSYTQLFFSEHPIDLARAQAICQRCTVRELCLLRAVERGEPIGVWGGEHLLDGSVVAPRRGRGRPPKVPHPTRVDEVTGRAEVA